MSLPPLPDHPWRLAPVWDEDEQKVLQAYGQQCRDAAFEEAAMTAESGFLFSKDGYQITNDIRGLK